MHCISNLASVVALALTGAFALQRPACADGTWEALADMPTPRYVLGVTAFGDEVFAMGGYTGENNVHGRNVVEAYDTTTNTWSTKAPLPFQRWGLCAVTCNGKIYAIGGATGNSVGDGTLSNVTQYDPATNSWTNKAPMPEGRALFSAAVLDDRIYVTAGYGGSDFLGSTYVYDTGTDSWSGRAPIPTNREGADAAVVGGRMYVIGGVLDGTRLATVEVYDPVTDTWETRASLPTARGYLSTVAINGGVYAIGGSLSGGIVHNVVERYDPADDVWQSDASMLTARTAGDAAVVGGTAYVIGGVTDVTDSAANEALTPGLENQPPLANAGADQIVEATSSTATSVTLNGTASSDPEGEALSHSWSGDFGTATGASPEVSLPLGSHTITLTVTDPNGASATDSVLVVVRDTTAPTFTSLTASPDSLWPPNHKMIALTLTGQATDACDSAPVFQILAVSSNEPTEGLGDGDTPVDWEVTGAMTLNVRAERSGSGSGRVYTITVRCVDASGNESLKSVSVTVPKSQKK